MYYTLNDQNSLCRHSFKKLRVTNIIYERSLLFGISYDEMKADTNTIYSLKKVVVGRLLIIFNQIMIFKT